MSYHIIKPEDYPNYQEAWLNAIPKDENTPFPAKYFKSDGNWIYGYEINIPDLKQENSGVIYVVFSLVIDESNTVKIVVFGVGNNRQTPPLINYYMLDKPILSSLSVGSGNWVKDEITEQQATDYTGVWGIFNTMNELPTTLFQVSDPRLKIGQDPRLISHRFPYLEINRMANIKTINAYFAIHKPPYPNKRELLTFVVQWIPIDANADESYYDVSVPCPPCCPSCP